MENFDRIVYHNGNEEPIHNTIVEKANEFDQYIEGTTKLWKNLEVDCIIENKSAIGRKFYKNNKVSYFEIFNVLMLDIMELSENISLLFLPCTDQNEKYDKTRCIGFRYFESSKFKKCNYFTLIKKNDKRYYILEKNQNIIDADGNTFYNKDLNCFSIMKKLFLKNIKKDKSYFPLVNYSLK